MAGNKRLGDVAAMVAGHIGSGMGFDAACEHVAKEVGGNVSYVRRVAMRTLSGWENDPDMVEAAMAVGSPDSVIETESEHVGRGFALTPKEIGECVSLYDGGNGVPLGELADTYGVCATTMRCYVIPGYRDYIRARKAHSSHGNGVPAPRLGTMVKSMPEREAKPLADDADTQLGGVGDRLPDGVAPWPVLDGSPLMPLDAIFDRGRLVEVSAVAWSGTGWLVEYADEPDSLVTFDADVMSRKPPTRRLVFEMASNGEIGYEEFERLLSMAAEM